ncbi:hypothetical protein [Scandinavium sp.]|uniref:hypothetical protein n=1 Tax=Scandinavium sp. TaxID=2830653 RepID=UPI00289CA21B|nr:hypothetical protein [Scandinavium sp.]
MKKSTEGQDNKAVTSGIRDRFKSPFRRKHEKEEQTDIPASPDAGDALENITGGSRSGGVVNKLKQLTNRQHAVKTLSLTDDGADTVTAPDAVATEEEVSASRFSATITRYRPVIERVVLEGLVGIAEDKLQDDELIADLFNKAYEFLPTPIRLVLPREKCLSWLMQNRGPLLLKLGDYRPTSPEANPQPALPPHEEK